LKNDTGLRPVSLFYPSPNPSQAGLPAAWSACNAVGCIASAGVDEMIFSSYDRRMSCPCGPVASVLYCIFVQYFDGLR
jgi:hypothetical protein